MFVGPYYGKTDDPSKVPYIAHFYAKTEEEFNEKINKGRCDAIASSRHQYFLNKEELIEHRRNADINEVNDMELHDKLEKLMGA